MRSKVLIRIGEPEERDHYSTIKYNEILQAYLLIFYQHSKKSEKFSIVRKATSKKLSEALSAAIDWADEGNEVVPFRRSDEARNGQDH